MAGIVDKVTDKFLGMLHLVEDEEEFYDDYDEEEEPVVVKKASPKKKYYVESESEHESVKQPRVKQARTPKVVPMRNNFNTMEVCVIKPSTVEDAREISDTLLSGRAVILNLEGLQVNLAQRIIDFTSGACYSINGTLKMVSNYIFIVTPEGVDISGDFQELLGGSNNVDVSAFK